MINLNYGTQVDLYMEIDRMGHTDPLIVYLGEATLYDKDLLLILTERMYKDIVSCKHTRITHKNFRIRQIWIEEK